MQLDEELMAICPKLEFINDPYMPEKQKGFIDGLTVYLNPNQYYYERPGTIGEEISHHLTGAGDITRLDTNEKRKQEQKARDVGAQLVVSPYDIIDCFEAGCVSIWDCAAHLGITTQVINRAVKYYARRFDGIKTENGYTIFFNKNGTLGVFKPFY
ncbi:ImmA/IrrE family metallo-endopeptidase [Enterococcus songbeiensis]|uniref:ImmA/IrrE family metallo-endopeptidase n=1 Tax=Enterococcus songbeiensis TaxID=2559927 RepID=UPI0010F6985B|nr:toxin [Enterococcus songbeiensis]